YEALRSEMGPAWAESERIQCQLGSEVPNARHAIESSRIARETIDTVESITGSQGPEWQLNTPHYQNPVYTATDLAIRMPWDNDISRMARDFLDGTGEMPHAAGNARLRHAASTGSPLPTRPARYQVRAANTHVDAIMEHAKWHPESFENPDFQRAW